jgi:hypothetical protein
MAGMNDPLARPPHARVPEGYLPTSEGDLASLTNMHVAVMSPPGASIACGTAI